MKRPILLNSWTDEYTLGIFCAKTNLVEYAKRNLKWLRSENKRHDLFYRGAVEHSHYSFSDIAFEIKHLRERKPESFGEFIREVAGDVVYVEICTALTEARDWETEEQKSVGKEMSSLQSEPRGKRK